MIPKNHKKQTSARPFPRRAPAMLAALLAGIPLSFHPLANPAARADGVTVSSDSSLKTEMESLTAGGTVSFTGAGTNSVLAAPVTLTANPYVLNPGGAAHVTLTGNNATGVFENTAATAADGTINLVLSNIAITDALGSSAIRSSAGAVNITLAGAAGTTELARNRNNGSDNAAPTFGGAAYGYTGITITGSQENLVLADNYGPRRGGGLYAENKTITINPVLSGTLLVTSNTANNSNGGAFSLAQSGTVILSGTHKDILIQNNYCRNGQGGAISSGGALLIAPRVSGTFLVTSNSIASSGNGGAFYSQDAMTITANGPAGIRFENNAAVGVGGALCVNASRIITLDAREGDIVFQGNVHTADKVPNAIYGNAGGGTHNGNNTLVIQGGRDVLFFDPVYASGTAEPLNTLLKTGAGTVLFSGSNSWRGSSTVSAGALLVNDGALLDTAATGKTFTLATGAIIGTYTAAASGTVTADTLNLSGILDATGTSQLHLVAASSTLNAVTLRAGLAAGNQAGKVVVHGGAAAFVGTSAVDLPASPAVSGTFDVLYYEAGTIPAGAFSTTLLVNGSPYATDGAAVRLSADNKSVQVVLPGGGGGPPSPVTVSFNTQGGDSATPASQTATVGQPYGSALPAADPTRSGCTFAGWWTTPAGTDGGTPVTAETDVTNSSNHTLHARWTVTVSFNTHDADSATPASQTATVGATYGTLPPDPTKAGNAFDGWFTAATGGTEVFANTTVATAAAHTLHAQWIADPPPSGGNSVTVDASTNLRDKISTLATGGTVNFTGDGLNSTLSAAVTLTSNPYVLNPGGAAHATLTGNNAVRVFENTGDINLTLSNVTITKGKQSAVRSSDGAVNITLADTGTVEFTDNGGGSPVNGASGSHGGAVLAETGINITGTHTGLSFIGNYADNRGAILYANAGGILIDTVLTDTLLVEANSASWGAPLHTQTGTFTLTGTYGGIAMRNNRSTSSNGGVISAGGGKVVINTRLVGGDFLIASNTSAQGGAFYIGDTLSMTISGTGALRVTDNHTTGNGGAFNVSASVRIEAGTPEGVHFENNRAVGTGGAIFMNRSFNFDFVATAGDIVFQGNTHQNGTPNALYSTHANGAQINISGDHDVLFYDPVQAASTTGAGGAITKTGAGSVLFSGNNTWLGDATVNAGALLVNAATLLDTAAAGKTFTLASGAVLGTYATAGSGTVKAADFALSGILDAAGASQLHLVGAATLNSITIRADLAAGNQSGRVVIHDAATFAGTGTIDLPALPAVSGTFDVFYYEAGTIPAGAFSATLLVNGSPYATDGAAVRLSADNKSVQVVLPGGGGGPPGPVTVSVSFNTQGGSAAPPSQDATVGDPYGTLPADPTRSGCTFAGWWTTPAGTAGGTPVTAETDVTNSSNHTLHARWTVTVSFDTHGGDSATPASQPATVGETYGTLPANPTKAGSTCDGWFTAATGGVKVLATDTVATAADHTLHAKWTATQPPTGPTVTVTLTPGAGATVSPASLTVTADRAYGYGNGDTLPTPARTGYAFTGWWTEQNAGGSEITAATIVTKEEAHTLYARWIANSSVTVTASTTLLTDIATLPNGGSVHFTGDGLANVLASAIPLTANPYALNPGGAAHVNITAGSGARVFENTGDINLTLSNLTITKGVNMAVQSSGGAVNITLAGPGTVEFLTNGPATSHGGAIYGQTGISIAGSQDNLLFTGNYANSRGGAMYAESGNLTINTSVTGTLLFEHNSSTAVGGVAYVNSGTFTITGNYGSVIIQSNTSKSNSVIGAGAAPLVINPVVADTFLIANNSVSGGGGVAYAANGFYLTANGPAGIVVTSNTAGNGGAFYLGGGTHAFTANSPAGIQITNNTANTTGGAIYMNNGGVRLAFDAAQGDIVFQGNKQGGASGTPNAIHANSGGGNSLVISGSHDVLFYDPINSASTDASSISKAGTGSTLFSGVNTWRGNVTISEGALLVNAGALLDTAAASRALTLAAGAVIGTGTTVGSGTVKAQALNLSGALAAAGASQLHLVGSATLNAITIRADFTGNQSGQVVIHDAATFAGTGTIDLQSIPADGGTFTVFRSETSTMSAGAFSPTLLFQGSPYTPPTGVASVQLADGNKAVQVVLPAGAGSITVTFDYNGGSGPEPSRNLLSGTTYDSNGDALPVPNARPGFTFVGWFDDDTGGTQVNAGDTVTANITLYARWNTVAPVTVALDANGGSVTPATLSVTPGLTYGASGALPVPTRSGHSFDGWFDAATGGTRVNAGDIVPETPPATLYAHWTPVSNPPPTVTLDANGGSVTPSSLTVTPGQTYGAANGGALPVPTRNGYSFDGWFDAATGGTQVLATTTVPATPPAKLYAYWTPVSNPPPSGGGTTVTFDPAGGMIDIMTKPVTPGQIYGPLPAPSRPGHLFAGWWTAADGNGMQIAPITLVDITASHTLHAKWTPAPPAADGDYLVIDLSAGPAAASYPVRTSATPPADLAAADAACRATELWLRRIQPGAFQMGSPAGEAGRWTDETLHAVTLTQPYYIGVFEITQKQWQLVMGANPSWSFGDRNPVEGVSYENIRGDAAGAGWPASDAVDAGSFFGRLRARTGLPLDLPTEAQWEYAARAGTATALNSGQDLDARAYAGLDALGRHLYNQLDGQGGFDRRHTAAGSYLPNAWGLYDMHGNVREFCLDWYGALPAAPATDPAGPAAGTTRVTRGGGWDSIEDECRSAARGLLEPFDDTPATGLRAAMLIKPPSVSLSPSAKNVTNAPGSLVFTVSNTGGGALLWSATISAGVQRWARIAAITNDGNGGTITVDYDANLPGGALRTAVLTVTEIGATGAAATVTIEQAANPAPNGGGDGGGGAPTLPALALLAALLAAARRPRRQDSVMK